MPINLSKEAKGRCKKNPIRWQTTGGYRSEGIVLKVPPERINMFREGRLNRKKRRPKGLITVKGRLGRKEGKGFRSENEASGGGARINGAAGFRLDLIGKIAADRKRG